jgi:hypothetical protein
MYGPGPRFGGAFGLSPGPLDSAAFQSMSVSVAARVRVARAAKLDAVAMVPPTSRSGS